MGDTMTEQIRILMIDSDLSVLSIIEKHLKTLISPRCLVTATQDPIQAIELLCRDEWDVVITDYNLNGLNGEEIFLECKRLRPNTPVIMISAAASIQEAVGFVGSEVYDFLTKPVKIDQLERLIRNIYERTELNNQVQQLREMMRNETSTTSIIGKSDAILSVIDMVNRCAAHSVNVLVRGESGTGKELVAVSLHQSSIRQNKPFITVNIAGLSPSLIESELFGHSKGAFTGADRDRTGRFEEADSGTLFIDEIGDISQEIQVKLLRAIQFKEFQRIGENLTRKCDVRIIAATSRDLESMMARGEFRPDLFYRLNVVGIRIPPLRERRIDIPLLVEHFLGYYSASMGLAKPRVSQEALHMLMIHDYPGNIRELQNAIEHALVFCRGSEIQGRDLPVQFKAPKERVAEAAERGEPFAYDETIGYDGMMARFEARLLAETLKRSEGNQRAAARMLGMNERRLRYRLEILGPDLQLESK